MLKFIAVGRESAATESALEWFFAGVDALMEQQIGQMTKYFSALSLIVDQLQLSLLLALKLAVRIHHAHKLGPDTKIKLQPSVRWE